MSDAFSDAARRDARRASSVLVVLILIGSRGGRDLDTALFGYLAATLVAFYFIGLRASDFWRRPASAEYARELRRALVQPRLLIEALRRGAEDLAAQRFIARRSRLRWLAHLGLSLGTLASFAITVPLVFGWMHFEADGQTIYRVRFFGLPAGAFAVDGLIGWLTFHALSLAGIAVLAGAGLLLGYRLRAGGSALASGHVAPLLLLLVVAATGLLLPLTRSMPAAFDVAVVLHELSVVTLLLALATSKLSHVLIRPLQIGARLQRKRASEMCACVACGLEFATLAQIEMIERLLTARGARFTNHVRRCPSCRRQVTATAQAAAVQHSFQPALIPIPRVAAEFNAPRLSASSKRKTPFALPPSLPNAELEGV